LPKKIQAKEGLMMSRLQLIVSTALLGIVTAAVDAGPPVRIGIGIGFGGPYYWRGYGYPYYYGGYPYPYPYPYAVPGPVVYPAPVVVQPGTVVATTPSQSFSAPEPTPVITNSQVNPVNPNAQGNLDFHLSRLTNPDEGLRSESVMELGRSKSERAIDPLAATLAGDRSATVREAAARALGIIASPRSLTALINAAQADNDREVRHSAQFAVEVIRANLKRN
jgi:hypothetical protein